jgi:hypothetical protein
MKPSQDIVALVVAASSVVPARSVGEEEHANTGHEGESRLEAYGESLGL